MGLNTDPPTRFTQKVEKTKLSRFAAYYVAHAAAHKDFLISKATDPTRDYVAIVLLSYLAQDSITKAGTPLHERPDLDAWQAGRASFEDQYEHYRQMEFGPRALLARLLEEKHLEQYSELFEGDGLVTNFAFVKPSAIKRVQQERPEIAKEFGF